MRGTSSLEGIKLPAAARLSSDMLLLVLAFASLASGKVFDRCELAKELVRLNVDREELSTWVCIAEKESNLNTSAIGRLNGDGSEDHGIFQISDKYWCSPQGWACNIPCSLLEDDDISDDWKCAKRIFRQHSILSGNGFHAWAVYYTHCSTDTSSYIEGCFDEDTTDNSSSTQVPSSPSTEAASSSTSTTEDPSNEIVVETYSAREGNLAAKVQVPDLEMMEKKGKSMRGHNHQRRLWKPWTWLV